MEKKKFVPDLEGTVDDNLSTQMGIAVIRQFERNIAVFYYIFQDRTLLSSEISILESSPAIQDLPTVDQRLMIEAGRIHMDEKEKRPPWRWVLKVSGPGGIGIRDAVCPVRPSTDRGLPRRASSMPFRLQGAEPPQLYVRCVLVCFVFDGVSRSGADGRHRVMGGTG